MGFIVEKEWITESGLSAKAGCVTRRDGTKRHRCGYVGVPAGHPLHKIGYSENCEALASLCSGTTKIGKRGAMLAFTASVDAPEGCDVRQSPDIAFDVHGGLTFSDQWEKSDDRWWFGFDCGHCDDGEIEPDPTYGRMLDGQVRSLEYVVSECESLARQIVDATAARKAGA